MDRNSHSAACSVRQQCCGFPSKTVPRLHRSGPVPEAHKIKAPPMPNKDDEPDPCQHLARETRHAWWIWPQPHCLPNVNVRVRIAVFLFLLLIRSRPLTSSRRSLVELRRGIRSSLSRTVRPSRRSIRPNDPDRLLVFATTKPKFGSPKNPIDDQDIPVDAAVDDLRLSVGSEHEDRWHLSLDDTCPGIRHRPACRRHRRRPGARAGCRRSAHSDSSVPRAPECEALPGTTGRCEDEDPWIVPGNRRHIETLT